MPHPVDDNNRSTSTSPGDMDAWILGSGLASITAAVHLIQEANVPASRIHILEARSTAGGGSVCAGDPETGYDYRAGGMPSFSDTCMEDLLSQVPSAKNPKRTVLDDIREFNASDTTGSKPSQTRFLARKSGRLARMDPKRVGIGLRDRMDLFMLASKTEKSLDRSRIRDHFSESFFKSSYWLLLATTFGFEPWHSAAEFRRFLLRFMHDVHDLNNPRPLDKVPFNREEDTVTPVVRFLRLKGVDFRFQTTVTDIIVDPPGESSTRVSAIKATKAHGPEMTIDIGPKDIVIVSVGSVMSGSTSGTNKSPPSLELMEVEKDLDENWLLWLELSTKHPKFGNAYNFCTRMCESRQESFTITLNNKQFFDRFVELTGDPPGAGTFVTLRDSNWLLSLSLPRQPVFVDQPPDVQVLWGYSSFPEREGNFVQKPMLSCSGEEIMTEILHQLQFPVEDILHDSITIPCVVPRMSATLLPRSSGDRPKVIPDGMTNMALIGQFVEIPDEVVVTMDYSVRGAQMAVRQLMGLDKGVKKSKRSSAINLLGLI